MEEHFWLLISSTTAGEGSSEQLKVALSNCSIKRTKAIFLNASAVLVPELHLPTEHRHPTWKLACFCLQPVNSYIAGRSVLNRLLCHMTEPNNIQEDADDLVQIRFFYEICVVSFAEFQAENTISNNSGKPV